MADTVKTLTVNGREVTFTNERNLLEVIRKAGIEIPTFCYHSELSIYGACRLCLVLVEGKGIMASCSTAPAPGMVVHTDTKEIRDMRKISVELLLANHNRECPTCARKCPVGAIAGKVKEAHRIDPEKCIKCGACKAACKFGAVKGI